MATTKKAAPKAPAKAKAAKSADKVTKTVKAAPKAASPKGGSTSGGKAPAKTEPKKAVKEAKPAKAVKAVKAPAANGHALPDEKQQIIEKFAQKNGDTGSPEVQVALLTHKIDRLIEHLDINKKDNHSRRGLLKVVAKRRRILNYLVKIDKNRYQHLIGELGLKK